MTEKVSPVDFFGAERFATPWGQVVSRRMISKCLWVYCEYCASVGVKRERYIRLSSL